MELYSTSWLFLDHIMKTGQNRNIAIRNDVLRREMDVVKCKIAECMTKDDNLTAAILDDSMHGKTQEKLAKCDEILNILKGTKYSDLLNSLERLLSDIDQVDNARNELFIQAERRKCLFEKSRESLEMSLDKINSEIDVVNTTRNKLIAEISILDERTTRMVHTNDVLRKSNVKLKSEIVEMEEAVKLRCDDKFMVVETVTPLISSDEEEEEKERSVKRRANDVAAVLSGEISEAKRRRRQINDKCASWIDKCENWTVEIGSDTEAELEFGAIVREMELEKQNHNQ